MSSSSVDVPRAAPPSEHPRQPVPPRESADVPLAALPADFDEDPDKARLLSRFARKGEFVAQLWSAYWSAFDSIHHNDQLFPVASRAFIQDYHDLLREDA
jgi:hypothetical protein